MLLFFEVTDDDSPPWNPLSGQESLSGAEVYVSFNCLEAFINYSKNSIKRFSYMTALVLSTSVQASFVKFLKLDK